ncbi:hypothetical protein Tco_0349823 [Tanacetum coccineum]
MQRPPLLEPNGSCFRKACFETYVKSKDIDLWQVIQNDDFYYEVEDSKMNLMKETPYELLEDDQKKKLGKNNEANMTLYNALPHKEYERIFMCKTAKEFSISHEETIYSGFRRFNAIVTSLKSLDPDYSSNNHVRKFLRTLPLKWRANVMAIAEAKDLATLLPDELIHNLKVYETIFGSDDVASKAIKEKVMPKALKANIIKGQTSNNSTCQVESDEDKEINLMSKNFGELFRFRMFSSVFTRLRPSDVGVGIDSRNFLKKAMEPTLNVYCIPNRETVLFCSAIGFKSLSDHFGVTIGIYYLANQIDIDEYISAELPDPIQVPRGCKVVSEMMMHEPCGAANLDASCMQNGPCNKNFSKKYNNKTFFDSNGHVKYQRRDMGVHVMKRESKLDNCNVVPYNRALYLAFEAHMNVEYCG